MPEPIVYVVCQQAGDLKQVVRLGIQGLDLLQHLPGNKTLPK